MSILLNNVKQLNDKEYMIYLSGLELVEFWDEEKMIYNPNIQRGLKFEKDEDGNKIGIPIYSSSNVSKIRKCMESNSFFVSQLTLNIPIENSKIIYDEIEETLSIENASLEILDGQHRLRALKQIKDKNENLSIIKNLIFPIKITHYSEEKAQQQFYQFTLGSKISSSRVEYFNNKDYSNTIVKNLFKESVLSGRIETIKNIISKKEENNIVSFATLKNAIDLNFSTDKFESIEEVNKVYNFLKDYFEKLFEIIPEFSSYEDRLKLKEENSLKCENFTFYGYVSLAAYLINKENWKDIIYLVNEINFCKNTNPWISHVIKKNIIKKKNKDDNKEIKYSIINNSPSRKDMSNLLLKYFKKLERELFENKNEQNENFDNLIDEIATN